MSFISLAAAQFELLESVNQLILLKKNPTTTKKTLVIQTIEAICLIDTRNTMIIFESKIEFEFSDDFKSLNQIEL